MKRFVKKYKMNLYSLKRESLVSYSNYNSLPENMEIKMLDFDLLEKMKHHCSEQYKAWTKILKTGRGG